MNKTKTDLVQHTEKLGFQLVRHNNGKYHLSNNHDDQYIFHNTGDLFLACCGKEHSMKLVTRQKHLHELEQKPKKKIRNGDLCKRCLAAAGIIAPPNLIKRTKITDDFNAQYRDAIELLEALGMINTTTDRTAKSNNLRFRDPGYCTYILNSKRGIYRRRYTAAAPILNRSYVTNNEYHRQIRHWICEHDMTTQAARVATIAIKYRKYKDNCKHQKFR